MPQPRADWHEKHPALGMEKLYNAQQMARQACWQVWN